MCSRPGSMLVCLGKKRGNFWTCDTCLFLRKNHLVCSDVGRARCHEYIVLNSAVRLSREHRPRTSVPRHTRCLSKSTVWWVFAHCARKQYNVYLSRALLIGLSACRLYGNKAQIISLGYKQWQKIARVSGNVSFGIKVSNFDIAMYLQTPWREVDLERVTVLQLARNFPAFHETRKFITVFTTARYLSASSTRWTQPTPSDIPITSILILSSNLRIHHPSGLFPTAFPSYVVLFSPIRATCSCYPLWCS